MACVMTGGGWFGLPNGVVGQMTVYSCGVRTSLTVDVHGRLLLMLCELLLH